MLNRLFYICLGLIFFFCLLINCFTLYDGHNWGGDFSQYIIHAQNIVQGKGYGEGIMLNNPVVYPPGFPLLIAPLIKVFGIKFKLLKLVNVFLWYAALFPIFMIMAKRLGKDLAVIFVLFLATSSNYFVFKQNILSDIPFYAFVSYTIYFFLYYCERAEFKTKRQILNFCVFLLLMSFSFLIRSAGIVLFFAATIFYLMKKDIKRTTLTVTAFILTFVLQGLWIGVHKGFFSQILQNPHTFLLRSIKKSALVFKALLWFFCPGQTVLTERIYLIGNYCVEFLSPILYCVILVYFIYQSCKRRVSFLGIFFALYLGILFVWTGFEADVRGFVRYVYPLTFCCVIFLYEIVDYLAKKLIAKRYRESYWKLFLKGTLVLLIFCNIFNIMGIYNFNDDVLQVKPNKELFEWIRQNTKRNETYMIWRPRPIALMTGRVGTVPWREDLNENTSIYQRIKELNISYLIFSKYVDQDLIFSFKRNFRFSYVIWENESYIIFKVL